MLFWCCSRRKSVKNLKPDKKFVKLRIRNKWKLHKEKSPYLAEFGLNKGFFYGRGRRQTMPSCGNPEKSAGLRFSLIFPTAAPTHAPFICHRQRSRVLPGTRVPRFKNFTHRQKIQAPQSDACIFWQGQKDLNPRHAVLETAALPTELYP